MSKGHLGLGAYIGSTTATNVSAEGIYKLQEQNALQSSSLWLLDGLSSATAGTSAQQLKADHGYNTDGVYWINLPTVGPTQIYCLMNNQWDGGGWMMAMKATRGTTFAYTSSYWTTANTLNPTDLTRNDADAKYNTMNYFSAKDLLAVFPDITTGTGGSIPGLGVWTWLENNFNIRSKRIQLINFFNSNIGSYNTAGGSGYFKRDAKTFSGWASGIFSSQTDVRFYGFNYKSYPAYNSMKNVRWGFGWNENGEGLFPGTVYSSYIGSNDVAGGIGLDTGGSSYSAGDVITCCADTTGINRSARVEVYIR